MTYADWRIKGPSMTTCNCDWGCPCQFNALPTHNHCRAAVGMRIDEGHFGDVDLSGLHWVVMVEWPGPIHEGGGACQPVVDERATPEQREAILKILSGEETAPGATIFNVFAATFDTVHDPLFAPIEFEADPDAATGRFVVPGLVEARGEPIRNPITGEIHHARVTLPSGFEYHEAEYASSTTSGEGQIPLDWTNGHAHLAILDMNPSGPAH